MINALSGSIPISSLGVPEKRELVSAQASDSSIDGAAPEKVDAVEAVSPGASGRTKDEQTGGERDKPPENEFDAELLDKIASRILHPDSRLSIDTDKDLGNFVYRFVDRNNGEVLRQYPAEDMMERMKALREYHERVKSRDT